jgi:cytochrome c556
MVDVSRLACRIRSDAESFEPEPRTEEERQMSELKRRSWGAIAVVVAVAITAAAGTATEAIKQRQKEMEGVKNEMMTLGAIAKKEQPFDAKVVHASAAKIDEHLAKSKALFPEGSAEGEVQTWAKSEIWTDRENFDKIMGSTREAAVEMQSVADAKAFMPALGKLGTGCKSCHEMYRAPKN